MAFHETTPTRAAGTFDTELSAIIDLVIKGPLDVMKIACPTLQILMENSRDFEVGPDGKISWNYLYDMYSTYIYKANQVFPLPDLDMISRMEYELKRWGSAAATNHEEIVRYKRTNRSLVDLVAQKLQAMHNGLTYNVNYMLFSDWAEEITANVLDTETELAALPIPPPTDIQNISVNTELIYSLPMVVRSNTTGHTFANVSSANKYWQCTETNGVTPTRATTGNNIDVVTAIPSTVAMGVSSNLAAHLRSVQIGAGYRLYCPTPADLYGMFADYILAERRRDARDDSMMADLGINSHFVFEEYNTVFYLENMMTTLWPNSLFFYDTELTFLGFDPAFKPFVSSLERLPHSTIYGTATEYQGQLMCIDRRSASGMHCWAAE